MNARPARALIPSAVLAASAFLAQTAAAEAPAASVAYIVGGPVSAPRLLSMAPDPAADLARGFDLLGEGRQSQAVSYFDRVIAAIDARSGPGARRCGPSSAARAGVEMVDPALCDAHFGKGFALIDMGRGDLAEAELRAATEMAPGNAHFANEYAELFKSRREWAKSYALFERAWNAADKDPKGRDADVAARALRGMGYNRVEMGDYAAAQDLFRRSLAYEPDSPSAKAELGHLARRLAIGS